MKQVRVRISLIPPNLGVSFMKETLKKIWNKLTCIHPSYKEIGIVNNKIILKCTKCGFTIKANYDERR